MTIISIYYNLKLLNNKLLFKGIKIILININKMTEPTINWTNELGSKLIKEIKIEIPSSFINQTQKVCLKCGQIFVYERTDEVEIFFRQFSSLKKGNLNLCFNCDELDEKLVGSKSFGKK